MGVSGQDKLYMMHKTAGMRQLFRQWAAVPMQFFPMLRE